MELILLMSMFVFVAGFIEKKPMPKMLCDCFSKKQFNATTDDPRNVHFACIQFYLTRTYKERWYANQTDSGRNYIKSLEREMVGTLRKNKRRKRAASQVLHGVREEIRTASPPKRKIFFDCLKKLKQDTSKSPNAYEDLALHHEGPALAAAHGGFAFLPWHRYYLLLLETAARRVPGCEDFVLLYWDSSLEGSPDNAKESLIWTDDFLGNNVGILSSGPFAYWSFLGGNPVMRNYNGEVINPSSVNRILRMTRNIEAMPEIENVHNFPHSAMGGTMLETSTAPQDPAFWLHHSYIDCLWEWFRDGQIPVIGKEYEYDYPYTDDDLHKPYASFGGELDELSNLNGLQSVFTDFLYKCDKRLTCPGSCERFPQFFYCNSNNECIARTRRSRNNRDSERFAPPNTIGGRFERHKRDVHATEEDDENSNSRHGIMDDAIQNSFLLDGIADIDRWAFLPVRVLYKRPKGIVFNIKPIHNGHVDLDNDIYSTDNTSETGNGLKNKKEIHPKFDSGSGATKVIVQSDGITFKGKYQDFGIVDARQKISETIAYVGVKNPRLGPSIAYISAFDLHGMVCKPHCLDKSSTPWSDKECSGVVEVTTKEPKMYGDTVTEAVMYRYGLVGDPSAPDSRYRDIYLTFVCEYLNESPWNHCQNA